MRLSKCERNKHLLRWSLEKSLLELLPLLLQRFLMFAEACQSFQHPGLQERAALIFLIGCTERQLALLSASDFALASAIESCATFASKC